MHKIERTHTSWELDYSKLNDSEKRVLQAVCFPNRVPSGHALQKRVKRLGTGDGYVDNPVVGIDDVRYLVTNMGAVKLDVSITTKATKDGNGNHLDSHLQKLENKSFMAKMKGKDRKHIYFTPQFVQEEMEAVLKLYADPRPTANMVVEEEVKEIEAPKVEAKKGLSNTVKGKVKKMAFDDKKSADEIATELDADIDLVIEYLTKISNG